MVARCSSWIVSFCSGSGSSSTIIARGEPGSGELTIEMRIGFSAGVSGVEGSSEFPISVDGSAAVIGSSGS